MIVSPQEAEDIHIKQYTLRKPKNMGACGNSLKWLPVNQKEMIVSPQEAEDTHIRQNALRRLKDMETIGSSLNSLKQNIQRIQTNNINRIYRIH